MVEQRKKDISKEYIKDKILNKDLLEIQESLQTLKDTINLGDNNKKNNYFGVDNIMNIIFNDDGDLRTEIGFEFNKFKSIMYMMISDEGKENLDLLYNELKSTSEANKLKENLGINLSNSESEVKKDTNETQNGDNQSSNENNNENLGGNNNEGNNKNTSELNNENNNGESNNEGNNENISKSNDTKIESLKENENYIYNQAKLYGITDNRQIAYILATVKGECKFQNIEEHKQGENREYGKIDEETGQKYYGRGFVQITWRSNYQKFTKIIQNSGLKFKDNHGNILDGKNIDLVKNPGLVVESNDLAAFILVYGMKNGTFTGKSLNNYINNEICDFKNARRIINGTNKANEFAKDANDYLKKLEGNNNEKILVGPDLIASNSNELGGIGSSIINGVGKKHFKNIDGVDSATTTNKKNNKQRFIEENGNLIYKGMELGEYCNKNGIKSFVFYFGGNEAVCGENEVKKAYNNIEKWSKYLQNKGIQPVLCTCIGEKSKQHSKGKKGEIYPLSGPGGFNQEIRNLGKNNNWPVLDFAKIENNIQIGGDGIHPTGSGYQKMRDEIDKCLT